MVCHAWYFYSTRIDHDFIPNTSKLLPLRKGRLFWTAWSADENWLSTQQSLPRSEDNDKNTGLWHHWLICRSQSRLCNITCRCISVMSLTGLHHHWIKSGKKHKGIQQSSSSGIKPCQPDVAALWQDFPCPALTGVHSSFFPRSALSPQSHCSPPLLVPFPLPFPLPWSCLQCSPSLLHILTSF